MKIKFKSAICILLCVLLVMSITACSSDNKTEETEEETKSDVTFTSGEAFVANGKDANGMDIVAENNLYTLSIDPVLFTTYLTVKSTGYVWKSNLTEKELKSISNPDVKGDYLSQVKIVYYDDKNNKKVYNSYKYATVSNTDGSTVATFGIENGIRVVYKIGEEVDDFLFPQALSVETYEELISQMTEEDAGTFSALYDLNMYSILDEKTQKSLLNTYPTIENEDLYIAYGDTAKMTKIEIVQDILKPIGWNVSKLKAEYDKLQYKYTEPSVPNFVIPLDYTLTSDGLKVNVPAEQIEYDEKAFRLNSISVLPFFGTSIDVKDGYMMIPDGSGALIDVNQKTTETIEIPFYGFDGSQWTKEHAKNIQHASLPVFGIKNDNNAFLAYVSEGSAQGSLETHLKTDIYPYSYLTSNYEMHTYEVYASEGMSRESTLQKYAYDRYNGNITINYNFLTDSKANYVGMAEKTRSYVFGEDAKKIDNANTQFCFETYGEVLRREDFIGYPLNRKRALTTIEEASEIFGQLSNKGVGNISVKYNNVASDEFVNDISDIGSVASSIGSKSDMQDFSERIKQGGGMLYPNVELVLDEASDGLSGASTHARLVEGSKVKYSGNQDIYMVGVTVPIRRTVLKSGHILSKIESILSDFDRLQTGAISLSTMGRNIFTDFTDNDEEFKLREAVKNDNIKTVEKISENHNVMVAGGNSYLLPYVDVVTDIALSDSTLIFETKSVPFLEMVLHGYVSYFGTALNLSDENEVALLKSVEYGAGIHYIMNFAEPTMLKNTNYSQLFSTHYSRWIEEAAYSYQRASAVLDGVQNSLIINHEAVNDKVFVTTYENGTKVVVNYGDSEFNYKGTTVGAKDFAAIK